MVNTMFDLWCRGEIPFSHPTPKEPVNVQPVWQDNTVDDAWIADCKKWRGQLLTGKHAHWCPDWDFLPMDETCIEWPCPCCTDGRCGVKP